MGSNDEREEQQALLCRWEAMRERVVASLRQRGWTDDDAQDLFGESILRAIQHTEAIKDKGAAEAWFWKLAHRLAVDQARHRSSRPKHSAEVEIDDMAAPEKDESICSCSLDILRQLPREAQEILRAVDLDDMAVKDFATREDITPNNASVRLSRARQAMRLRMFETCHTSTVAACMTCDC
jgi:RNA polymerase sigma-70 factor (ECF subfamily)